MNNKVFIFAKRHIAGMIIAAIFIVGIGAGLALWFTGQQSRPEDLGPQLEYIGKQDLGCNIPFVFCDSKPYSEYYFATNLDKDALEKYFERAEFAQSLNGSSADYTYQILEFKLDNKKFWVTFYDSSQAIAHIKHKPITKPYVISIPNYSYDLAKSAL